MEKGGKSFDCLAVGEIYVDHIFSGLKAWPKPGEEVLTNSYAREVGGGVVTTACALGRLGRKVGLVGAVGVADEAWIARRLAQYGVDTNGLTSLDTGATGLTVALSTRTDRSFFTHIGVNNELPDLLTSRTAISLMMQARHVHFALPLARATADYVLPQLATAGCTTSLDVGCRPDWLRDATNNITLSHIDFFLPNESEGEIWSGATGEDTFFAHAARAGLTSPVLKLGARGAEAEIDGKRWGAVPPAVVALDTTGAGDAFDAGFIDALLDGAVIEQCLGRGCVVGALSTRAAGGLGALPDRDEEKKFRDYTSIR